MATSDRMIPASLASPLRLEPFRAIRIAPASIGDPAASRLLGRPHHRVPERLAAWRAEGRVLHDPGPALYLHEYTVNGITVRGLVGALDVSRVARPGDRRAVMPHEAVRPRQVENLTARFTDLGVNPTPLLLFHDADPELRDLLRTLRTGPAWARYLDRRGQAHRVWRLARREDVDRVAALLADTEAVIADGHHRYSAYLALQQRYPGTAADRGLAMLVDQGDTPLFLGAIHRVWHGVAPAAVAEAARQAGHAVTCLPAGEALNALGPHHVVLSDDAAWFAIGLTGSERGRELDRVHATIVPRLRSPLESATHHPEVRAALTLAHRSGGTALLLPAPSLADVLSVVAGGDVMPEKATSFQPKPVPGTFMRAWLDEPPVPS
ncbi:DUF1015 family protein [Nocardioides sp.]|uniref:DUF1015 family protein n=1 Tax=Nocardioides sp. TaxID=35761 RepID=UPI003519B068